MPGTEGFGEDSPKCYGVVKYINANGDWIERQIKTPQGDYGRYYDAVYQTFIHGEDKLVKDLEIITNIEFLKKDLIKPPLRYII